MIHVLLTSLLLAGPASAQDAYTTEQLKAKFPYDLGAAEIDVAKYPKKRQDQYETFKKTCSQCHTLARPINSPLVTAGDWNRYVKRMKVRTKSAPHADIPAAAAKEIVDFLAYDAKVRKVDGKAAFDAESARLRCLFAKVSAERKREGAASDEQKVKPLPNDAATGVRPQP
ncbi:MAG: hypothetical protein HY079_04345 [Elusimicrobia bacterium]|nr:hypothetical protein [Elusimicrobiota bacterium]